MHHGSLIAVSFAWHRICGMCPYFCAIVLCPCPSLAPCPPPCPSSCGPRATSLVMGGWLVLIPIRNPFRITASAAAARHRFFPDQAPHSLVSLWPVLPLTPCPHATPAPLQVTCAHSLSWAFRAKDSLARSPRSARRVFLLLVEIGPDGWGKPLTVPVAALCELLTLCTLTSIRVHGYPEKVVSYQLAGHKHNHSQLPAPISHLPAYLPICSLFI